MAKNTIPIRMPEEFNVFSRKVSAQRVLNNLERREIPPSEVARMITSPNLTCKDMLFKELTTKQRSNKV